MALFTYVTEKCGEEAARHAMTNALEKFVARVEKAQDTRYFDPFPPPYLVKKQFGKYQGRLIASRESVQYDEEEHTVLVFLSVMMRGARAYDAEFGHNPESYGDRFLKPRYTIKKLEEYIAKRLADAPVEPKPLPSEAEYGYMYQALAKHGEHGDDVICESAEWTELTRSAPFKDALTRLFDALSPAPNCDDPGGTLIPVKEKPGWSILARYYPDLKLWFLLSPLIGKMSDQEKKIREKYKAILMGHPDDQQPILQRCRRAYPSIVLADDVLWSKIQQDPLGNLALSPEETGILEASLEPKGAFPLFINGRAGSGKSTILQYLFTDLIFYHLTQGHGVSAPVYFACSTDLLQQSRSVVESLLQCSAKYWECDQRDAILAQAHDVLDGAFKNFRGHLLSMIPSKDRNSRFAPRNRVDYAMFRKLWMKKYSKEQSMVKEYSPDLCWHVIRTYIKGASAEVLLEPDEYQHIDAKQRSVSQKTYEKIYTDVWERWYKLLSADNNYWDDQDLSRYILDKDLIEPVYPGIFCDEAQDFTRIELEVILRMSLFSARDVAPSDIAKIPFVFAGDQFQTINPTGFRWDSVKAWFAEKFIFTLDPSRRSGLKDPNYRELTFNYRSSSQIVGFSNYVQALRSYLFSIPGLQPQLAWDDSPSSPVVHYRPDDMNFWSGIKKLGDVVFILPCHENEEMEYIRKDPVLSHKIVMHDGVPSIPVFSAARAKGLEFQRVVVYGFGGEYCPLGLLDPVRKNADKDMSAEKALPMEYFVNRLYVAVSRPKSQLFILDDDKGIKQLWEFACNMDWEKVILDGIKKGHGVWSGKLSMLQEGGKEHLNAAEPVDILANAEQIEKNGRARSDSWMLRQAAVAYKNSGKAQEAVLCGAEAAYIDDDFIVAGDLFLEGGKAIRAVSCFWIAGKAGWQKIINAAEKNQTVVGQIEYAFADCILKNRPPKAKCKVINRFAEQIKSDASFIYNARESYLRAVEEALKELLNAKETVEWVPLYEDFKILTAADIAIPDDIYAKLAFKARDYGAACTYWERAGTTGTDDYRRAMAETMPYPERLKALDALRDWPRISADYAANAGFTLDREYVVIVGGALAEQGAFDDALPLLLECKDGDALRRASESASKAKKEELANRLLGLSAVLSVAADDWSGLKQIINPRKALSNDTALLMARALGRSSSLSSLPADSKGGGMGQKEISEFLRSKFIPPQPSVLKERDLIEIGAAIERANNRRDSLLFYEAIQKGAYPSEIKNHADRRRIVCMERQMKNVDDRSARRIQNEIDEARRKIGIGADHRLPEFAALSNIDELVDEIARGITATPAKTPAASEPVVTGMMPEDKTAEAMHKKPVMKARRKQPPHAPVPEHDKLNMSIGDYRLSFIRSARRLNIENANGEILIIKQGGDKIDGDLKLADTDDHGYRKIEGSDLKLSMVKSKEGTVVNVVVQDRQVSVSFQM